MTVFRSITTLSLTILLFSHFNPVTATTYLSPLEDILLPASDSAAEPLKWLGANSPYFPGMLPTMAEEELLEEKC